MNSDIQNMDVIIVGSGPGGATVAKELSKRKMRVLILEWGDYSPSVGSFWQASKTILPGKGLLFTPQMLALYRAITTGGSSVLFYATAFPVPFDTLKSYGIDIENEVKELWEELPVAPVKDEMVGPMAKRIMNSAIELGYNWQKLNKIMYQDKWRPGYKFGHYGDPHQVKWDARRFIEEALTNGAKIINGAKVNKVILERKKALGVEFTRKFRKYRVFAPKIVVSAGGIGTAVILRESGLKRAGYDFFIDPLIGVRGTLKDIDVPNSEIPMTAGVHLEEEGYMMTDMAHPFAVSAMFAAGVLRFHKIFSRRKTLQIMIKAKDELGGKLTDKGGVRKILDKREKQKLQRGYDRACKILKNAGAKSIFMTGYTAAHPGGTVKIGDLVDSNLMTEYEDLYVCDCSVFPEACGIPPTTTIMGLGKRLAKHLVRETGSKQSSSE